MDALSIELARRIGQVLTLEDAKDITRAVVGGQALDLKKIAPGSHASSYTLKPIWLDSAFDELESQRLRGLAEIYPEEPVAVCWDRIRELERMGRYVIFAAHTRDSRLAASLWLYFTPSLNNGMPLQSSCSGSITKWRLDMAAGGWGYALAAAINGGLRGMQMTKDWARQDEEDAFKKEERAQQRQGWNDLATEKQALKDAAQPIAVQQYTAGQRAVDVLRSVRVNGERSNGDQVSPKGARGV